MKFRFGVSNEEFIAGNENRRNPLGPFMDRDTDDEDDDNNDTDDSDENLEEWLNIPGN